jgi:hypothetical protein
MKFRRQLGLTLMEVLVVVTVIMVIAAITFVGLRAWRDHLLQAACMQKLSRINEALMAYRAEWGNPHEVVGSAASLGLPLIPVPLAPDPRYKGLKVLALVPERFLRFGKTEEERRAAFSCPRWMRWNPGSTAWYEYWPSAEVGWNDEEHGRFPYSSMTSVLKAETPVVSCLNHYGPKTEWEDRTERYLMLTLTLGGTVKREFVTGLLVIVDPWSGLASLRPGEELTYVLLRDPEGFQREMKLREERQRRR